MTRHSNLPVLPSTHVTSSIFFINVGAQPYLASKSFCVKLYNMEFKIIYRININDTMQLNTVYRCLHSLIRHRDIMTGAACGAGNATLPEQLISPLVFIEVHVVLSFVSPYFML